MSLDRVVWRKEGKMGWVLVGVYRSGLSGLENKLVCSFKLAANIVRNGIWIPPPTMSASDLKHVFQARQSSGINYQYNYHPIFLSLYFPIIPTYLLHTTSSSDSWQLRTIDTLSQFPSFSQVGATPFFVLYPIISPVNFILSTILTADEGLCAGLNC